MKKEETKNVRVTKKSVNNLSVYTVRQKRCWALIAQQLNQYLPKDLKVDWTASTFDTIKKYVPFNHQAICKVKIDPHDVVSNRSSIVPTLEKMRTTCFVLEDEFGNVSHLSLIYGYERTADGNYLILLPVPSVVWVLGINQNNLFTTFHLKSFLSLSSSMAMDFYLYISDNYNRGCWETTVEELKERFHLFENQDNYDFSRKFLTPVLNELDKKQTLINAECVWLEAETPVRKRGRRSYNRIRIQLYERVDGKFKKVEPKPDRITVTPGVFSK